MGPDLREAWVEIDIGAALDLQQGRARRQRPGDVEEQVRFTHELAEGGFAHAVARCLPVVDDAVAALEPERLCHLAEALADVVDAVAILMRSGAATVCRQAGIELRLVVDPEGLDAETVEPDDELEEGPRIARDLRQTAHAPACYDDEHASSSGRMGVSCSNQRSTSASASNAQSAFSSHAASAGQMTRFAMRPSSAVSNVRFSSAAEGRRQPARPTSSSYRRRIGVRSGTWKRERKVERS